jgi:hypothetical protein
LPDDVEEVRVRRCLSVKEREVAVTRTELMVVLADLEGAG